MPISIQQRFVVTNLLELVETVNRINEALVHARGRSGADWASVPVAPVTIALFREDREQNPDRDSRPVFGLNITHTPKGA